MYKILEMQTRPTLQTAWFAGLVPALVNKWNELITNGTMACYATVIDGLSFRRVQIFNNEASYNTYLQDSDIMSLMSARLAYYSANNIQVVITYSNIDDTDQDLIKYHGILGVFDPSGGDQSHTLVPAT